MTIPMCTCGRGDCSVCGGDGSRWSELGREVARYNARESRADKERRRAERGEARQRREDRIRPGEIHRCLLASGVTFTDGRPDPITRPTFKAELDGAVLVVWWDKRDVRGDEGYAWTVRKGDAIHGGPLDTLELLEHLLQGGFRE